VFLFPPGRAYRDLDGGRATGDDRPSTRRAGTQWKAADDRFFVSRCKAAGGGKKRATAVAGRRARRSRSSVRPSPFEDAVAWLTGKSEGTRQWRWSASAPYLRSVANLQSHQPYPWLSIARPVHPRWADTVSRFSPSSQHQHLQAGDDHPVEQRDRSHQPAIQICARTPRPKMSISRTEITTHGPHCHCDRVSPCARSPERRLHQRKGITAALRVSDWSRMAETRRWRGSGAAESAARRATPSPLSYWTSIRFQAFPSTFKLDESEAAAFW